MDIPFRKLGASSAFQQSRFALDEEHMGVEALLMPPPSSRPAAPRCSRRRSPECPKRLRTRRSHWGRCCRDRGLPGNGSMASTSVPAFSSCTSETARFSVPVVTSSASLVPQVPVPVGVEVQQQPRRELRPVSSGCRPSPGRGDSMSFTFRVTSTSKL